MKTARDYLIECYLDFFNNYITVEKWAEHNGMTIPDAVELLALAKSVTNKQHPEA